MCATALPSDSLREISQLTKNVDAAFCNLECAVVTDAPRLPKVFSFAAHPSLLGILKEAGFGVVSLANNHTLDCGKAGVVETMEHLRKSRILFCGAGRTDEEARTPTVVRLKAKKVGFLAYSDIPEHSVVLIPDRPSIAVLDDDTFSQEIRKAKASVDILVVSLHWGWEYQPFPNARQRRLAEEAVEAGADIVAGHHPHVLQPLEVIERKGNVAVVSYSLGNFIFDSRRTETHETMLLECNFDATGLVRVRMHPMRIENCFPRISGAPAAVWERGKMAGASALR